MKMMVKVGMKRLEKNEAKRRAKKQKSDQNHHLDLYE